MPDVTLTEARFEQIASHHKSCAGLCETNTVVAALRASREQLAKVRTWAIWRAAYEHADEYRCRLCRTSWIIGREAEHHEDGCPATQPASKERK